MIYFITAREVARVKIGFSDNPQLRFVKMQADSPCELVIERICEGSVADEAELHQHFASDHVRGEWFALSDRVEEHMRSVPAFVKPEGFVLPGKLGAWLKANGHTTTTFGKAVGVTNATISRICGGKQGIRLSTAEAIIAATNGEVTLQDLADMTRRPA